MYRGAWPPVIAGIRRGLLLFGAIAAPTAVVSLLLGLATGTAVQRALATGFYIVGAMLMLLGVLSGARGPLRAAPPGDADAGDASPVFGMGLGRRRLRTATGEERREAVFGALLFLVLGLIFVALGAVAEAGIELL